jgi:hypothetical protein
MCTASSQVQAGALNSDLFAREPGNTHLLLSLLEDEPVGVADFYVRYYTVQLLTVLLSSSSYRLQVRLSSLNRRMLCRHVPWMVFLIGGAFSGTGYSAGGFYTIGRGLLRDVVVGAQDAILASPMGVVRLMDMMMDREVIRNEALLLLVALTRANEEVQKIAAFEGAFERLFNIIRCAGG